MSMAASGSFAVFFYLLLENTTVLMHVVSLLDAYEHSIHVLLGCLQ